MLKIKTFNYRDRILDYGFTKNDKKHSKIKLEEVVNSVNESLFIVDTTGKNLLPVLKRIESYLNQNEKILVGLTNEKTLYDLKQNGINNGLFRSTNRHIEQTIVIKDKTNVYLVFDDENIIDVPNQYANEIFDYVNYVFWSNSDYELLQGVYEKVNEARLSVVAPSFKNDLVVDEDSCTFASGRKNFVPEHVILEEEKNIKTKAVVIPYSLDAISDKYETINVRLFENRYYPIEFGCLISATSFENQSLESLEGRKAWFNGKYTTVLPSYSIEKTIRVPFDYVDAYEPNYDKYASEFNELALELQIKVNIEPIVLNQTFALSKKYGLIEKVKNQINETLNKIEKIDSENKYTKQIESIRTERLLSNQVQMFNDFVNENEFGVGSLNNKKSSYNPINENKENLIVPNELIGKLYTKEGKDFLATTEEHILDAKEWLKENKLNAILIKA